MKTIGEIMEDLAPRIELAHGRHAGAHVPLVDQDAVAAVNALRSAVQQYLGIVQDERDYAQADGGPMPTEIRDCLVAMRRFLLTLIDGMQGAGVRALKEGLVLESEILGRAAAECRLLMMAV